MFVSRSCMMLCVFVLAHRVMMLSLMMMMSGGVMMCGG
jgi:hypothetical protein